MSKQSLDSIIHNLWIKAELFQHQVDSPHAVDIRRPDIAKEEAKQAIVEAVERIYGDSDGLREFAGLNLIKPVPEVPSKRKER